jgi:phage-related minor tail protein
MRKLILLIALAGLSVPALADTAQQEKMKSCNADAKAKGLKGDAYKKFRDDCLKAKPEAATTTAKPAAATTTAKPEAATTTTAESKKLTPQQEKMKSCNGLASSQGLSGDARKKFMSSCLKG